MPVPASIDELSPIAADNYPAGTEKVFPNLDDYLRFHASCLAQLRDRIEIEGTPLAGVTWWGGARSAVVLPRLPVDGQLLNRADYPELWALVSAGSYPMVTESAWQATPGSRASFSSGDGSATFRMPDLNGKQSDSIGAVVLRGDGAFSAGNSGAIQEAQNASHGHAITIHESGAHSHTINGSIGEAGAHTHTVPGRRDTSDYGGLAAGEGPVTNEYANTSLAGGHSHQFWGSAASSGVHAHAASAAASGGNEARSKAATGVWVMRVK